MSKQRCVCPHLSVTDRPQDVKFHQPVHYAAARPDSRLLQLLIDAGADVNAKVLGFPLCVSYWYRTQGVVRRAAQTQSVACARLLVDVGAKLVASTVLQNAFHVTVARSSGDAAAVVKELLKHKDAASFVDAEDCSTRTPLAIAVTRNDIGNSCCRLCPMLAQVL